MFSLDPSAPPAPSPPEPHPAEPARTRIRTEWTARRATPADADLLHVATGTIVLHILRTISDADGNVIKATTTLCPGARTVLHHSYPISPNH